MFELAELLMTGEQQREVRAMSIQKHPLFEGVWADFNNMAVVF